MSRPRNGENKVYSDVGCLPPSEHEVLFSGFAIVETLVWPFMVVEVEIVGQSSMQLAHGVVLVEIDVLTFDDAPQAFAEDVVEGAAAVVYADLNVGGERACGDGIGRELHALAGRYWALNPPAAQPFQEQVE